MDGLGIIYERTNMETREAVARAICMRLYGDEVHWIDHADVADAAIAAMAGDGVLVRLDRHEGYEDVHPQLVAEDAIGDRWPSYETLMHNVKLTGAAPTEGETKP